MNISQALTTLGVTEQTLTADEKNFLDTNGYLPLHNILDAAQVNALTARLAQLAAEEGEQAGLEVHQEKGTVRLSNLVNKGEIFEVCYTHPRVLAAIAHVLKGNLKLSSLNARAALPGEGLQSLHVDWRGAVEAGDFHVCNSIWLLDDFTAGNGATRVVPGSQNWAQTPQQAMSNAMDTHLQEVILVAPAGTVVIFNSHTWHGGTLNRTQNPRRALHSYYCRRDQKQQTDQRSSLNPETVARLSLATQVVLDVANES